MCARSIPGSGNTCRCNAQTDYAGGKGAESGVMQTDGASRPAGAVRGNAPDAVHEPANHRRRLVLPRGHADVDERLGIVTGSTETPADGCGPVCGTPRHR